MNHTILILRLFFVLTNSQSSDICTLSLHDALPISNNYQAAVGKTRGKYTEVSLTSDTDIANPDAFRNLVVKQSNGTLIRLQDIARVELGSQTYDSLALYKGQPATYVAIELAPGANPLTVADLVKAELPDIESQLPSGLNVRLAYDASDFIDDSINEVIQTLL